MFRIDGSALVTGTVASDARYTDAVDIKSRIEILDDLIDIDGNGEIDALTDGLLTLRYLLDCGERHLLMVLLQRMLLEFLQRR